MEISCPIPPLGEEEVLATLGRIEQLPTLPDVVQRIVLSLGDPESRVQDLSRTILADQAISSQVLRVANSAYYGLAARVTSLERAVMVLGFDEVRRITLAAMVIRSLPGGDRDLLMEMWRHSLATAWFARHTAERVRETAVNEAYAAGLLHDLGKVVIARYFPRHFHYIRHYVATLSRPWERLERQILGADHGQIGDWLARLWNLPELLREAISHHHQLETDARKNVSRVTRIAALANRLAEASGFAGGATRVRPVPETLLFALDLTADDGRALRARGDEIRELVQTFF